MSASDTAGAREQTAPQAVVKAKRRESNWFAKLLTHLANIYHLSIKELRGIRADPIMLAARSLCLHHRDLRRCHRRLDRSDEPFCCNRR